MASHSIRHYPSLAKDEFKAACLFLEQGCQGLDNDPSWLGVHCSEQEDEFGLHMRRRLSVAVQSPPPPDTADAYDGESDKDDEIFDRTAGMHPVFADFWITLSPTYEVPVLWLQILNLPSTALQGFEAVYEYLVPADHRPSLQAIGNIGGISMAPNPMTDMPNFFIHPCNTPAALLELRQVKEVSPEQYILLWLGLVGPAVGLHVPTSIVYRAFSGNEKS